LHVVHPLVTFYYQSRWTLSDHGLWKFPRKHFRAELSDGAFLKLNRRRARLDGKDLQRIASDLAPKHLFMSVLDYLFPERVSDKRRLDSYPVGGELVVDIDSYLYFNRHAHAYDNHEVCEGCLEISKRLTLQVADEIRRYYSRLAVVFSGRRGFHLHVLDFMANDWTRLEPMNPLSARIPPIPNSTKWPTKWHTNGRRASASV
jgi:DNA primase catalytic subunit